MSLAELHVTYEYLSVKGCTDLGTRQVCEFGVQEGDGEDWIGDN